MSSNIGYKTVVIAVFFSVILSTSIVMTVPQVQEAIRGPQGISEATQAELVELAIRIDELENIIAELEASDIRILQLNSSIVTLEETIESLESDIDQIYDYIWDRIIGGETSSLWDILAGLQEDPGELGELMQVDPVYPIGVDPWDTLIALSSDVYDLRSEFDNWRDYLRDDLIPLVSNLDTDIPDITPIFDSEWISINAGDYKVITTLSNPNVFVYMVGRNSDYPGHQTYYGGRVSTWGTSILGVTKNEEYGAKWYITASNQLKVHRYEDDGKWEQVRVRVWQLP